MNLKHRAAALLLALLTVLTLTVPAFADGPDGPPTPVTILFTHDLHSHLLPAADENGNSYGGYARLKTLIDREKAEAPDALFIDGGDFSMGSLFQTSFRTSAVELRVMGALGIDVTTFGNHEYDYGPEGLGDMLNAAANSGDPLPILVETSFLPPQPGQPEYTEASAYVQDAFERVGVKDYVLLERGGVWFAVFSSFGIDAEDCSPTASMVSLDRVESAKATIAAARQECIEANGVEPFVICLSHSGTEKGKGEDYELAKKVDGIDLILSAHTHTTLPQPVQVNDTYIVSAGEYSKNLGVISFYTNRSGLVSLQDYRLIPVDDSVPEDEEIRARVQDYKSEVERDYLSYFDLGFDEVLIDNPYAFDSVDQVYATQHDSTLCSLFTDAYRWAAEETTGQTVDVALTASGVIRESIPQGPVTASDVFTAASLGNGASDLPGGALLSVWLTGADLKNVLEIDASVQPIMDAAQLFFSGLEYSYNTNRMIFNKVDGAMLRRADGTLEAIEDDRLYHVVTGTYAGNMLGSVKEKSFGMLSVTPRTADGTPMDLSHLTDYIILREDGSELKEWYAIASYLQAMNGEMDARYAQPDGRKLVYASLSPIALLRSANRYTYIALAVILLLLAVILLVVRAIRRRRSKKKTR